MKILITGATGFVGRNVVSALQRKGIKVVTLTSSASVNSADHYRLNLLSVENWGEQIAGIEPHISLQRGMPSMGSFGTRR